MSRLQVKSTLTVLGIALIVTSSAFEAGAGRRGGGRRGGGFGRRGHSGRSFGRRSLGRRSFSQGRSKGGFRSNSNPGRRGSFLNRLSNRGSRRSLIGSRGRRNGWSFGRHGFHRHHRGFGFGYYRRGPGFGFAFTSIGGGYANPYCEAPIGGYDYASPVESFDTTTSESATGLQAFDAAISSFYAGKYDESLTSIRSAVRELSNNGDVHQFHGLVLFAQGNYREAAAVVHASLTSSSGWNWTTLRSFYEEAATYTTQMRALEESKKANPEAAALRFLLGYHYLMLNHKEAAQTQLKRAIELQPNDELAKQLLELAGKVEAKTEAPTTGGLSALAQAGSEEAAIDTPADQPTEEKPSLTGTWTAKPAADVEITLTLNEDNSFVWKANSNGQNYEFSGNVTISADQMTLARENSNEQIAGTVTVDSPNSFRLKLDDGPELVFNR